MEVENQSVHQQREKWEGYVDWKGRPALRRRHGGFLAASFVLVVEVMENMAFLANASNLVLYVSKDMHFTPSKSSNTVTNFMGTAFLLALLGGFLSDAFFTTFQVYLTSAALELLGLVVLTVQAYKPSLQPPRCDPTDAKTGACRGLDTSKAAMLYMGLYLVAAGVGGIKGSLPTHGAEQFDESTQEGRIKRSTFFNYYVFCLSAGGLIATTFVVWVEDNRGWKWGFLISTMTILISIPVFLCGSPFYRNKIPSGSPITTISKVILAGILNSCMNKNSNNAVANMVVSPPLKTRKHEEGKEVIKEDDHDHDHNTLETLTESYKCLNNAINPNPVYASLECSIKEVEEVKIVLKMLPIFASTIILNCCLAQLSTFSVEQAASMDTNLGTLKVPPASLPVFPIVIIMVLAPVYDHLIIPFARKITKRETGISHLQRIGTGLLLSIAAMGVAALVEVKRKRVARENDMLDLVEQQPLPITFFWIAIQYALLGSADLFCLAGMLEFFFTEAPSTMRSLATSLSWASLAIGYYLSSVIVSIVNAATSSASGAWLSGNNLNHYHLDRFYWLLCALGAFNFLNYVFWATRYKYTSTGSTMK